jgi:homoserine kinase
VPATSANLGPGFDCLGLALDIYLRVRCAVAGSGLRITAGDASISTGDDNLIYQAMLAVYSAAGAAPPAGLSFDIDNAIPLSRGLGSSSAAIVAGLLQADAVMGTGLSRSRLLEVGLPLEGHPDNLAPALFGGLVTSAVGPDGVLVQQVPLPRPPRVALFIPERAMSTAEARRVLPATYSRADAVFNAGRTGLLVAALAGGNLAPLRWAMEDRIHQPYRASLLPELPALVDAALAAGAAGAALSGAGSTVIALCAGDPAPIAEAMSAEAARLRLAGRAATASIHMAGALSS